MTCANLGISMSNKSTASPPALSDNGKNQGEARNSITTLTLFDRMVVIASQILDMPKP